MAVTAALVSALVKVLVKDFKRLYLLNLWMEVVHTCPMLNACLKFYAVPF